MIGTQGKYFSALLSTTGSGEDLISKIKTLLGINTIVITRLTLICDSVLALSVDINDLGVYSDLWRDGDGYIKLSLSDDNVVVKTLKVKEAGVSDIFLAVIFK